MKLYLILIFTLVVAIAIVAGIGAAINQFPEENDQMADQELSIVAYKEKPLKPVSQNKIYQQSKIELKLAERTQKMNKGEKVRVAIWANTDNIKGIKRPEVITDVESQELTQDRIERISELQSEPIKKAISANRKQIIDHLKSKKVNIVYESSFAPVIFAEASKDDIRELEARSDVSALFLGREYQPLTDTSVPTVLAQPVWSYIKNGTKVAVIEEQGIGFANPYLKKGTYYDPVNPNIGSHPTAVAGIIASTNTNFKGVAYQGPALLSANANGWLDSDLIAASDWAVANGARVLSNSWGADYGGTLSPMAHYYDWLVYHYGVTVVFAAGNNPNAMVYDPAIAYNVIAVGSFYDRNSGWNWWDDYMSSFSSYLNPPSIDREEPDVVAPGEDIASLTTSSPWIGSVGSGTSYAAPHVAGLASMLINKTPALGIWPEAVRAIIMASADHNIEGSSRVSDKDGAGGINAYEAYKIASTLTKWSGEELSYNGSAPWYSKNISLGMGQRVRIAIAWDSISSGYLGNDSLNSDLDLSIERYYGKKWIFEYRAGTSESYDNNYEIVEFNAPVSGLYRAKVNKTRWEDPGYTEHLGYAVYIK